MTLIGITADRKNPMLSELHVNTRKTDRHSNPLDIVRFTQICAAKRRRDDEIIDLHFCSESSVIDRLATAGTVHTDRTLNTDTVSHN
jgi:hypothetical protein